MEMKQFTVNIKEKGKAFKEAFVLWLEKTKEKLAHSFSRFIRLDYTAKDFFLVLSFGILIGAGIKTATSATFTIGYEDYKVSHLENIYKMNDIQKTLLENGGSLAVTQNPSGEMCTE